MSAPRDSAAAHYTGQAGRHYHESKRLIPAATFPWVSRARAELFVPHARPADTVVEIGVGYGWNLAGLDCRRRIGVDLTESLKTECDQRGIEFHTSSASLPDQLANVLICHHTLEHADSPGAVLDELRRLCAPDGVLLLAVPCERERRYHRYDPAEPNRHLYSWTVQTLCALVETHGFEVTKAGLRRYGQDRFAARASVRLGLGETGFRLLRSLGRLVRRQLEIAVEARPVTRSTSGATNPAPGGPSRA